DRHPLGGAAPRALQRRAIAGRADVLEPAHVGRVRRDLREPGAPAALLPRASAAGSPILLHDAYDGGRAPRRGLMADGGSSRVLLFPAAEPAGGRAPRRARG